MDDDSTEAPPIELLEADFRLRTEIMDRVNDPVALVDAICAYYRDADRADRTPRAMLYLHIGLLAGAIMRQRERIQ